MVGSPRADRNGAPERRESKYAVIRFVFRAIGLVLFAAGFIVLVSDGVESLAADEIALTPLAESWSVFGAASLDGARDRIAGLSPGLEDPVFETVLSWPTFAVVGGLGLVLILLTPRRRRRAARFSG